MPTDTNARVCVCCSAVILFAKAKYIHRSSRYYDPTNTFSMIRHGLFPRGGCTNTRLNQKHWCSGSGLQARWISWWAGSWLPENRDRCEISWLYTPPCHTTTWQNRTQARRTSHVVHNLVQRSHQCFCFRNWVSLFWILWYREYFL